MGIIYRAQKGAPLSSDELDGNFRDLNKRLETIEQEGPSAEGIGKITIEGDELTIISTLGSTLGSVQIPLPSFAPRGLWQKGVAYAVNDLVCLENRTFCCINAHQSTEFGADKDCWRLLIDLSEVHTVKEEPKIEVAQQSEIQIQLCEIETLPKPIPGHLALLMTENPPLLVYGDGRCWRKIKDSKEI